MQKHWADNAEVALQDLGIQGNTVNKHRSVAWL